MKTTESDSGLQYDVLLDGKTVKTPGRNPLSTTNTNLGIILASEWACQGDLVRPVTMPVMALASTCIDLVSTQRETTYDAMLEFLRMDGCLFRTPADPKLYSRQTTLLDPLVEYFSKEVGLITISSSLLPPGVSDETIVKAIEYMDTMTIEEITALSVATSYTKSFVAAFALINNRISPAETLDVALIEERYQRDNWGVAEGDHDVDSASLSMQLHACKLFADLHRIRKID